MINHILTLILTALFAFSPSQGANAPTNALIDPPQGMRPTADAPPPYAPRCVEDEVQVTGDDGTVICLHREGDGFRTLPN